MPKIVFLEDFHDKTIGTDLFLGILSREGFILDIGVDITRVKGVGVFYEQLFYCNN